jgi:4-hydroxybenzoate polyprenyltransferase
MKINVSDISRGNWVDRWLPLRIRPYARLARFDRPIGTWLLLFPCWWSLALAIEDWEDITATLYLFLLFGGGAHVMRGAGCCLNDIADRNYDSRVSRTKDRPIPAGIISVKQAIVFMAMLGGVGLLILIQLNKFSILLGIASLLLVVIYPFCKRFTNWPQFILGLTFNWGALLGWAAVHGQIQTPAILLYIAGIFWTLGYDTIYALQDKEDDSIIGIKSSAMVLGKTTRRWLWIFYGFAIFFMGLSGWSAELSWPFYLGLCCAALQAIWQIQKLQIKIPNDCLSKFRSNRLFGWLFLCGIIVSQLK